MAEDARRYGWRWAVASVAADGKVALLDPALAKRGAGVTLDARAEIDNVLRWLDSVPAQPARRGRRQR